jgi:hypothetical protein
MKTTIAVALFLCSIPVVCLGDRSVLVAPPQEFPIRISLRDRGELKPLAAEYHQIVFTRLKSLQSNEVTNVFGPKLESHRDLNAHRLTNSLVLPLFAPDSVSISGLLVTNNLSHADLYAVGEIGYAEFIYQWDGSMEYARVVLYFRPDAAFVPLQTEADFSRRLEWEKPKWLALKKWLDAHLPKVTNQNEPQK